MRAPRFPFTTTVNGVSHRQTAVAGVVEGDPVTVLHDPGNEHDPNACEVRGPEGDLLGYLPRAIAERLALGSTGPWSGVITDVLRRETIGLRVEVDGPAGAQQRAGTAEPPENRPDVITASTGRLLGRLDHEEAGVVYVRTAAGLASYPAHLVTIAEPSAAAA